MTHKDSRCLETWHGLEWPEQVSGSLRESFYDLCFSVDASGRNTCYYMFRSIRRVHTHTYMLMETHTLPIRQSNNSDVSLSLSFTLKIVGCRAGGSPVCGGDMRLQGDAVGSNMGSACLKPGLERVQFSNGSSCDFNRNLHNYQCLKQLEVKVLAVDYDGQPERLRWLMADVSGSSRGVVLSAASWGIVTLSRGSSLVLFRILHNVLSSYANIITSVQPVRCNIYILHITVQ